MSNISDNVGVPRRPGPDRRSPRHQQPAGWYQQPPAWREHSSEWGEQPAAPRRQPSGWLEQGATWRQQASGWLAQPAAARRQPTGWRRAAVPLGCALALTLSGVLLLTTGSAADHPAARTEHGATATAAEPPGVALRLRSTSPQPAGTSRPAAVTEGGPGSMQIPTESADLADPLAGPVPDAYLQRLLDTAPTSAPPALPTAARNAAVRAAGRVLIADLTGTGRDRFPGFWSEPTHSAWSRIRVQASTTQTAGLNPARVTVTLIWAGTSPTGEQVERRRTVITMELTERGWWPVSVS